MTETELVLFQREKDLKIATITLNRPDRLNALLPEMRVAVRKFLDEAARDDDIRALIITGAGRGFCSGADVQTVADQSEAARDEEKRRLYLRPVQTPWILLQIRDLLKPTIAALNGIAAGAGVGLALVPDIVIASDQARLRVAFTGIGLVPADGLTYLLPRLMGMKKALEFMYTNDILDAAAMEKLGLVNQVVPHADLMKVTRDLASRIAQGPPVALGLTKKAVLRGMGPVDIESQMDFEHLMNYSAHQTEDHREGVKAFQEKRKPVFKGR
jgi:2-(1,2-epoxy-1,2-dihydrophenyl)acetyl-CoA isomerase